MTAASAKHFYIVAREPGAEHPALPAWACRAENPAMLSAVESSAGVSRVEVAAVPGAYQLLNVLQPDECRRLIEVSEELGYLEDAAVSLPRSVRHNDNVVWIVDDATHDLLWSRVAEAVVADLDVYNHKRPLGLNARFRFYRYGEGDYFEYHSDGAWPGSRVINGELVSNAYPDRYSHASFLLFLNDGYRGGATRFLVDAESPGKPATQGRTAEPVDVNTPVGGVLCFPHGFHPLHCLHSSAPIESGAKYIIRTDLLFEL